MLSQVRGKRILDIASGSNTSSENAEGEPVHARAFEPWFCRIVTKLGGETVAVDIGDLTNEPFEHYQVDLGQIGALNFLPDVSFDGIHDSRLFGSREFRTQFPRRDDRVAVAEEIKRQEARLLKPTGKIISTDTNLIFQDYC